MIMQPDVVSEELVQRSILEASRKKPLPAATRLRFDRFGEGLAAQVLYRGPYSCEGPTIERLPDSSPTRLPSQREAPRDLPERSFPRRTRELGTIIRQPVSAAP